MRQRRLQVVVLVDDVRIIKESYALYGVLVKIIRIDDTAGDSELSYEHRVYRRFSEFWDLKIRLEKEFGMELPYELPQRQFGIWKQSSLDPVVIEERKLKLAGFLQDMLNDSFDTKWKNSQCVCKFLKLSVNWSSCERRNSELSSERGDINDPTQWLKMFRDSKHSLESCKRGVTSSATRDLVQLRLVLHDLENALKSNSEQLGEGEYARRQNLLQMLKKDMNQFALRNSYTYSKDGNSEAGSGDNSKSDEYELKQRLFGEPAKSKSPKKPAMGRRRLGESAETARLNNQELLQLHKDAMNRQDLEIEQIHKIVQRQKGLSLAMNQELLQDNELLDSLNSGVDDTAFKLRTANRKAKWFNNE